MKLKIILIAIIILSWLFFAYHLLSKYHLDKDRWEKVSYEGFINEGTEIYIEKVN